MVNFSKPEQLVNICQTEHLVNYNKTEHLVNFCKIVKKKFATLIKYILLFTFKYKYNPVVFDVET